MRMFLLLVAGAGVGCREDGCLSGRDPTCIVPPACPDLPEIPCDDPSTGLKIVQPGDPLLPQGPAVAASAGDVLLSNRWLTAVVSAVAHPRGTAPTGGHLVDLAPSGRSDALVQVAQVVGALPDQAVAYTDLRTFGDSGGIFAVQVTGAVAGLSDVRVATRYEVRPCEPGLRIRTEIANTGSEAVPLSPADGWTLGGRGLSAFAPGVGAVDGPAAWPPPDRGPFPWVGFGLGADASYAVVACDGSGLTAGLHEQLTSVGMGLQWLLPGRSLVLERYVTVAAGPSVASAAGLAQPVLDAADPTRHAAIVTGTIELPPGDPTRLDNPVRAWITVWDDGDPPLPWTSAVPDARGDFALRLPPDRTWRVTVDAFGVPVAERTLTTDTASVALGGIAVPAGAAVSLAVERDGFPDWTLVHVLPADREAAADCTPLLGLPDGGSPACNRVLVGGNAQVDVPAGRWELVATGGPFATLDRETIEVAPGEVAEVELAIQTIEELQPPGTLATDAHVHAGGSGDSALPLADRVASLAAADLGLVVATDHDRVADWSTVPVDPPVSMTWVSGVEATPQVPYALVAGEPPTSIGHWIAWPIPPNPAAAWGGAPPDEGILPAEWRDRLESYGWSATTGLVQLPVGSSRVDLQACKLEYSIVSPK